MKKFVFSFILLLSGVILSHSQNISIVSGDLSFLKNEKYIFVEYRYDNMTVGRLSEDEYVKRKIEKYNDQEAGKGDSWYQKWVNDRVNLFQPAFEELLNKHLSSKNIVYSSNSNDANYKMIVHTTFTEPGFRAPFGNPFDITDVVITGKNAYIDLEITFVNINNETNKIAKIILNKSPGRTALYGDLATGIRISESYAKAGKELAKFLLKKAYK